MPLSKITTNSIADNAVTTVKTSGVAGMSEAVLFRMSSALSGNADPITNWEVADDAMSGRIGTGITQSSGIFTFGSTGIYLIEFQGTAYDSGTDDLQINLLVWASSDSGSSYDRQAMGFTNLHHAAQHTFAVSCMVDITNTSTNRVKFEVSGNNGELNGSTDQNYTTVSFLRLGDT